MSAEQVRIHLENAILVGSGKEAKYAKVLVGERDTESSHGRPMRLSTAFNILGFVRGYQETTREQPTRMWLADYNILAIAEVKVATCCDVGPPHTPDWRHARRPIQLCSQNNVHPSHTWQYTGSVLLNCPGVTKVDAYRQRPATSRDPMDICPLRRQSSSIHPGHHYHNREGITIQCSGWGGRQQ